MTNDWPQGEVGHADDIVDMVAYEAPMPPPAKEFLPWHRPRKQYVRHHQWCREISQLVTDSPPADGLLKYFGLPGVDLLDLRHFHSTVCEPKQIGLRFLGFIRDSLIYLSKLHAVCVSIWNGQTDDFDEATEPGQWI